MSPSELEVELIALLLAALLSSLSEFAIDERLLRVCLYGWWLTVPPTLGDLSAALETGDTGASSSACNLEIDFAINVGDGSSCSLWPRNDGDAGD